MKEDKPGTDADKEIIDRLERLLLWKPRDRSVLSAGCGQQCEMPVREGRCTLKNAPWI